MTRSHPDRVRVLLLQPDQDDREMYTEFLRHEGFAPIAVSTARAGLRLARHVAIVVSGLVLPGQMDGLEFVARLKADVRTRRIPAIVLTACAFATDRERASAAGCDLYLAKPCLPEVLVR